MSNNFNDRSGAGLPALLAALATGVGTLVFAIKAWWAMGWGPGNWAGNDIRRAYWLAFWGHLDRAYVGDLGSWPDFKAGLIANHMFDSFLASWWVPFALAMTVALLTAWGVVRLLKSGPRFVRGSRFIR